ncbi:hypothetical protein B9Z19DRAFT_1072623, partial [Tuber borchii]
MASIYPALYQERQLQRPPTAHLSFCWFTIPALPCTKTSPWILSLAFQFTAPDCKLWGCGICCLPICLSNLDKISV